MLCHSCKWTIDLSIRQKSSDCRRQPLITWSFFNFTANEGSVKIIYKCMVPIYVFPEMKLLFPKQNYNVLSPSSYTHLFVRDQYISRIGLLILLRRNMWSGPILGIYKSLTDTWMWNWDWGRVIPRKGIHKWDFRCSVQQCMRCKQLRGSILMWIKKLFFLFNFNLL